MQVWKPGRDLAVDEVIARYEGHAKETTTIPNKPTPTGFKIWSIADMGFLLCWNWHIPGTPQRDLPVPTWPPPRRTLEYLPVPDWPWSKLTRGKG
jgi:hypothetical protein